MKHSGSNIKKFLTVFQKKVFLIFSKQTFFILNDIYVSGSNFLISKNKKGTTSKKLLIFRKAEVSSLNIETLRYQTKNKFLFFKNF